MRVAGIDPGLSGGLALLSPTECYADRMPLRTDGKEVDGAAIGAWLFVAEPDLVIVERQQARNTFNAQGKAIRKTGAEFRFATGYGIILGVLQSMALPYRRIQPMAWKAAVLGERGTDKAAAIRYCQDTYPTINLIPKGCRVPQDGLADAICLAAFGLRGKT